MQRLELARKRQQLGHFDNLNRLRRIAQLNRRLRLIIVGNLWRGLQRNGATGKRGDGEEQNRQ
jgi:hypothetical protein